MAAKSDMKTNVMRVLDQKKVTYEQHCYANTDAEWVRENVQRHIPTSPFLLGSPEEKDKIIEAKQESWKMDQMQLFEMF